MVIPCVALHAVTVTRLKNNHLVLITYLECCVFDKAEQTKYLTIFTGWKSNQHSSMHCTASVILKHITTWQVPALCSFVAKTVTTNLFTGEGVFSPLPFLFCSLFFFKWGLHCQFAGGVWAELHPQRCTWTVHSTQETHLVAANVLFLQNKI